MVDQQRGHESGVTPGSSANPPPPIQHREFLERALISAGEWTRFADAKAVGVLVLLGFGIKDLIDHAGAFIHPHASRGEIAATVLFIAACVFAALVVAFVTHALFSRLSAKGLLGLERNETRPQSRLFFGEVSRYGSQTAYTQAVLAQKPHELLSDIAGQVYEISCICRTKHAATQRAYALGLLFLITWASARIVLAT